MAKQKKTQDRIEDTIYGVNSDQQAKINTLLNTLGIEPRKKQNIKSINIDVEINYFPKQNEVSVDSSQH